MMHYDLGNIGSLILIHIIPKKRTLENIGNIRFQIKLEFVPLEMAINAGKLGNRANDAKR